MHLLLLHLLLAAQIGLAHDIDDKTSECLESVNLIRRIHLSEDLRRDSKLVAYAKLIVSRLDDDPSIDLINRQFGINWFFGYNQFCRETVSEWYSQVDRYDYNLMYQQEGTRYFTQLVWAASNKIGCATSNLVQKLGNKTGFHTVCTFDPKGNIAGKFGENVFRPIDRIGLRCALGTDDCGEPCV